ncbi:Iron-sulfur assembly protein 1 [Purpureocillium takamizusanense]|uniref:Iron-sulfur assembly protein 1 n=1 Tax=Purpureocillium takamizusanense TaxID=2060973 RepID=A0A9Q8VC97_9HYPO|nr:Iron-sulfur assembly protein 1 [Purpureocillium takamizusanense]UNI19776.1 Iron-sulfur assembly protein 1 [Purpureocillium takamizusanense]
MNASFCLARTAALRHSWCALRPSWSAPRLVAAYHSYSLPTGTASSSPRSADIHETPIAQPETLPRVHETRPPTPPSRPSEIPEQQQGAASAAAHPVAAKPAAPPKNSQPEDVSAAASITESASASTSPTTPSNGTNTSMSTSTTPQPSAKAPKAARPRPKLRARKAAMKLTPAAVEQLRMMLDQPDPKLIKVGVRNRGCSGLAYHLEYVDKPGAFDETVEQDGVKVLIDSKALFSIIGSEMDWAEDKLNQRFVFKNPNIKDQCGCGESFMV